jgi:3-hydroxybutyryl-CoA dehydrogenase
MENVIIEPIEEYGLSKKEKQRTLFSKIGIVGCGKDGQNIAIIASINGIEVVFIELSE